MRRARHFARPLSVYVVAFAIALSAIAALALPPKAEAAIHLGSTNVTSLTNGLTGYWTFDGAVTDWNSNTTRDLSGNGNTGTLVSMSTSTTPAAGKIGQAFSFNGSTNYVDTGARVTAVTDNYTLSAWVKINVLPQTAGGAMVYNGDDSGGYGFGIGAGGADTRLYGLFGSIEWVDAGYTFGSTNSWYHVVMERDNGLTKFYVNGSKTSGTSVSAPGTPYSGHTTIGAVFLGQHTVLYNEFNGTVDDVRIYNRALSATEIQQLYRLGQAQAAHSNVGISNGLVGYWTFDGKDTNWSTGQTKDISGNGNTGQMRGMSTSSSPKQGKIGQGLYFSGVGSYLDAGATLGNFGCYMGKSSD
jgi:hypothetical protein